MELVDGWDLGRVLQRAAAAKMPLPRELGLYITAEVCRALAYAHGKTQAGDPLGIVHRDVSPHNVLISEQGEVKLTDFGIAKAMNKREHTGTGVVKGKVAFMSPEQAMGKAIDARSDLFSLGTVLYQLMVGVRPFEAPTDLETLLRVQKADFRPPDLAKTDLEPELAAIITRAMQLDPADRYQSADEMLVDVERVLRTVFRPAGQTELKRWLAALEAKDGVPSMGKAAGALQPGRTGTGEMEDVVLVDSTREGTGVGEEDTSLAVLEASGTDGRPRGFSRHRSAELRSAGPLVRGRPAGGRRGAGWQLPGLARRGLARGGPPSGRDPTIIRRWPAAPTARLRPRRVANRKRRPPRSRPEKPTAEAASPPAGPPSPPRRARTARREPREHPRRPRVSPRHPRAAGPPTSPSTGGAASAGSRT